MVKRTRGVKLQLRRPAKSGPAFKEKRRQLELTELDPKLLVPDPDNARIHPEPQINLIQGSISEFDFNEPILVSKESKKVIAGHGRLEAAKRSGLPTVPVILIDHLSPEQERAYALMANRSAERSSWDPVLLLHNLERFVIPTSSLNLELTGFDTKDFDRLRDLNCPTNKAEDPADQTPPLAKRAVTRAGDLWRLGRHLVLCADATDATMYRRLLGAAVAQMAITDPPFNVPIRGHVTSQSRHREFAMAAGEMTREEFSAFLKCVFVLMYQVSCDGAIHFVFMDWRHIAEIMTAASLVYDEFKQLCVWAKDRAGMGSFYRSQQELVFVFKVGTAPHINNFCLGEHGRFRTNLWQYPSPRAGKRADGAAAAEHPTVKPAAMLIDAIKDCSKVDGIILDPFGGSGSTLIAAERTQRQARLIEIDPLYVDLTIRRWQDLTGEKAILDGTGERFSTLEASHHSSDA